MDRAELETHLKTMGPATIKNRSRVASLFIDKPAYIGLLLEILFESKKELCIKAAYTLELVCLEDITSLEPHLDIYTSNIQHVTNGSAVRSLSKISSLLAIAYARNYPSTIRNRMNSQHIELFIEAGFDWLISEHKVAIKAHSMELLYQLGLEVDWVHGELKLIIEKNMGYESCGYQARGKKILGLINRSVIGY